MTWRKNARTITKEHFSDGTTIDGNRIDTALDDVVDRVNEVPYGDLRKRWVPITYVAGWTPQAPSTIETTATAESDDPGKVAATHHWPWMVVRNTGTDQVVAGTTGSTSADDDLVTNPYRVKGAQAPGVFPFGGSTVSSSAYASSPTPIGEQYAWTRSWFLEKPSILDAIDLVFELDHADIPAAADKIYTNTFLYGTTAPEGYDASSDDHGLAIIATVDNEFDREDQNLADIEVMRKTFRINNDKFSPLPLSVKSDTVPTYDDFAPKPQVNTGVGASTVQGVRIHLDSLNIPIHQNARLRVSVVIPMYPTALTTCGWIPNATYPYPWLQQKVHMTVTMLEEVTSG